VPADCTEWRFSTALNAKGVGEMAEPLWTWDDLVAACGGAADGGPPEGPISGFSIDTRSLSPGEVFVALKGARDGHDFVAAGFSAGAAAALVSGDYVRAGEDGPLLRAPDTLRGLEAVGVAARARLDEVARVIGVTGSVGKTGTKEMLRVALGAQGATHAPEKSFNNHWGVPLTLARMPAETRFGIFEMGMNHAGEISPLSRMVRPHVAIITAVEAVHLEHFASVDGIAEAKAEIFDGLLDDGVAVLNRDNSYFDFLKSRAEAKGARVVSFGMAEGADCRAVSVERSFSGSIVTAKWNEADIKFRIAAPGDHLVVNALAVLAAVDAVGGDVGQAAAALSSFAVPAGRGEQSYLDCGSGQILLIDESYNANPASMRAAIRVLGLLDKAIATRRIAVLGDMLELGEASAQLHADLAGVLGQSGIDLVFTVGPHMASLHKALPAEMRGGHAETAEAVEQSLLDVIAPGDAIMVKGSLGSRMGPIVSAIKNYVSKSVGRG